MQLKNLILAASVFASSVSSVLALPKLAAASTAPGVKGDDYESWKSCLAGNTESCVNYKQFYPDETQLKKAQEKLVKCIHEGACKEWKESVPKTLEHYIKDTLPKHFDTSTNQIDYDPKIIMRTTRKMKGIENQVCTHCDFDWTIEDVYGKESFFSVLSERYLRRKMLLETIGLVPFLTNFATLCGIRKFESVKGSEIPKFETYTGSISCSDILMW